MADIVSSLTLQVKSEQVSTATNRLRAFQKASRGADAAANKLAKEVEREATAARKASKSVNQMTKSTDKAGRSQRVLGRNVDITSKGLRGIVKRSLAAASAFIALNKAWDALSYSFQTTAAFERIGKQLNFITGGAREAAEAMEFLENESGRVGQVVTEAAPLFARLSFAMQQSGLSAKDAKELYEAVGSAAATFSLSQSEVNSVLLAFTQVASKGKLQAEEIRKQIGERLPGAFGLAAKAIGTTTQGLSEMLDAGIAPLAKDFLPAMAKEMQNTFGTDIANKTDTITASVGRLKSEMALLIEEMELSDTFKGFIQVLTRGVRSMRDEVGEKLFEDVAEAVGAQSSEAFQEAMGRIEVSTLKELEGAVTQVHDLLDSQIAALARMDTETREIYGEGFEKSIENTRKVENILWNQLEAATMLKNEQTLFNLSVQKSVRSATQLTDALREALQDAGGTLSFDIDVSAGSFARQINKSGEVSYESFMEGFRNKDRTSDGFVTFLGNRFGEGFELIGDSVAKRADKAFDFSNVKVVMPPVSQFQEAFDSLADSLMTPMEAMDAELAKGQALILSHYKALNKDIDADGRDLMDRLKRQYDQDVENFKQAQRDKEISSSHAGRAILAIGGAIEDGLVNAATRGKDAFADMAQFILAEIQRVFLRMLVLQPLYGFLGGILPGNIGGAFTKLSTNADGGYVPSGTKSIVGEAGPEIISGPAVVTSTKTTAAKTAAEGRMGNGSPAGPTYVINMPGATMEAVQEVRRMVIALSRSVDGRSVAAIRDSNLRSPGLNRI